MPIPSTSDFESDREYVDALHGYGNAVASKRQIHSKNHNSTCFKGLVSNPNELIWTKRIWPKCDFGPNTFGPNAKEYETSGQ